MPMIQRKRKHVQQPKTLKLAESRDLASTLRLDLQNCAIYKADEHPYLLQHCARAISEIESEYADGLKTIVICDLN
jgi:hypothetical protein